MSKIKYVTLKIPQKIVEDFIDPRIESGVYTSRTDVVKAALRMLANEAMRGVN